MTRTAKRITDPDFRYTPASKTDIRKTFARVRRELAEAEARTRSETDTKVKPLQRKGRTPC
jgi:hypothetical protein